MKVFFPSPEMNEETNISFSSIDVSDFKLPEDVINSWLIDLAVDYDKDLFELSYMFCSDEYLHKMNLEYLNHDTYTDIITFDLSEENKDIIQGECFISIDRIKDNAGKEGVPLSTELLRVISHGLLHLCGLKDKTVEDQEQMTHAENRALSKIDCSTWNIVI